MDRNYQVIVYDFNKLEPGILEILFEQFRRNNFYSINYWTLSRIAAQYPSISGEFSAGKIKQEFDNLQKNGKIPLEQEVVTVRLWDL